jgi:hypothetical protein
MMHKRKFAPVPGTARRKHPRKRTKHVTVLALAFLLIAPSAVSESLVLGNFSAGDLSGWKPKVFQGETSYTLVADGERRVLKAESNGAASGLFWKIGGTIPNGNERTKEGDDYAARVYVVFPRTLFWRTKAINYIWANKLPKGESLPNAFTSNAMMVAVESGDGKAGTWVTEERNLYEDYRRLFGEEPPEIGAVALMTDTDNTGGKAVAYYGDITLGGLSSP